MRPTCRYTSEPTGRRKFWPACRPPDADVRTQRPATGEGVPWRRPVGVGGADPPVSECHLLFRAALWREHDRRGRRLPTGVRRDLRLAAAPAQSGSLRSWIMTVSRATRPTTGNAVTSNARSAKGRYRRRVQHLQHAAVDRARRAATRRGDALGDPPAAAAVPGVGPAALLRGPAAPYDVVAERLGLATGSIGLTRSRCLKKLQRILDSTDPARATGGRATVLCSPCPRPRC